MRFSIEIDGEKQFDREFLNVPKTLDDLTPVWKVIEGDFHEIEEQQFDSEGGKGLSGKWPKLSPAYEEIKLQKIGSLAFFGGILYLSGRLKKSLTRHTEDSILEITKDAITLGTSVPYAKYHQDGGGNLPQRKVIDFSQEQRRRLQKSIQKELLKLVRANSGFVATEENFSEL